MEREREWGRVRRLRCAVGGRRRRKVEEVEEREGPRKEGWSRVRAS